MAVQASGRSPRVRGSRLAIVHARRRHGSIPAGAGEPLTATAAIPARRVDPRGCGGACCIRAPPVCRLGRSPRVRGSRAKEDIWQEHVGSIPAGAGEPLPYSRAILSGRVDPRGCGGADPKAVCDATGQGRSPRVRGSHIIYVGDDGNRGSIPAGAGEPSLRSYLLGTDRVDPRGCGGARDCLVEQIRYWGRSPRVRGSPMPADQLHVTIGSIPAGAGEPK